MVGEREGRKIEASEVRRNRVGYTFYKKILLYLT